MNTTVTGLTEARLNAMIEHALTTPQHKSTGRQVLLFKHPVLCMGTGAFVAAAMVLLAVTLSPSSPTPAAESNMYTDMADMMILDTMSTQI